MRRIGSRFSEAEEESAIDITPMLDVVFIMLIFFIVTATFVKESGIDVNKPDAATAVKQEKANILSKINQLQEWNSELDQELKTLESTTQTQSDQLNTLSSRLQDLHMIALLYSNIEHLMITSTLFTSIDYTNIPPPFM